MPLLSFKDLHTKKGHSDTTIWRMVKEGKFPRPVKIARRRCWDESEIDQYVKAQLAMREEPEFSATLPSA